MLRKFFIIIGVLAFLSATSVLIYVYPSYSWMVAVKTVPYDSDLTVYVGGGNTTVITSKDGSRVLIIDTKKERAGKTLRKKIHAHDITIINTHIHQDHTRMNRLYPNATVIAGNYSNEEWKKETGNCKYPDRTLLPGKDTSFIFENEHIYIRNVGQAHTTNDLVIYLPDHKMLVVGDLIFHKMHPAMLKNEANCSKLITVLDSLYRSTEADIVIPGHGKITNRDGLLAMKEYYSSIYNAVDDPMNLQSVKKKYRHYFTFMGATGFDKNVNFIRWEKSRQPATNQPADTLN